MEILTAIIAAELGLLNILVFLLIGYFIYSDIQLRKQHEARASQPNPMVLLQDALGGGPLGGQPGAPLPEKKEGEEGDATKSDALSGQYL